MSQFNTPTYDIERPTGQCAFTGRVLQPGEPYVAVLVEYDPASGTLASAPGTRAATGRNSQAPAQKGSGLGMKRVDISIEAWNEGHRPERLFGYWKSIVPQPNQKKKLFVDNEVLMNLFRRLADAEQPERQAFRFVLGLILMRKRLLRYDGSIKKPSPGISPAITPGIAPGITPATANSAETASDNSSAEVAQAAASVTPAFVEYWLLTPKGEEQPLELLDPQLDEEKIQQVTAQLSEILEAEL